MLEVSLLGVERSGAPSHKGCVVKLLKARNKRVRSPPPVMLLACISKRCHAQNTLAIRHYLLSFMLWRLLPPPPHPPPAYEIAVCCMYTPLTYLRTVLDGYQSTQHLLQNPTLGLGAMLTSETAAEMWIRLMRVCISVSKYRACTLRV